MQEIGGQPWDCIKELLGTPGTDQAAVQEKVVKLELTTKEKIKRFCNIAWIIPGTEDLLPYIPKKAWIKKWAATIIGYPVLAAILSGICLLF